MSSFFMAGPDRVCWEVTAVRQNGPFRLEIRHAHGCIVEYFTDVTAALLREQQIEQLFCFAALPDASGVIVGDGVC